MKSVIGIFIFAMAGLTVSGQTATRSLEESNRATINVRSTEAFRVYRLGHFYVTDRRGAKILRNAVNEGYRHGSLAGERDHKNRSYSGYRASEIFKDALIGYMDSVAADEYRYYFRRGFELGYYDGFYGMEQYGKTSKGITNIRESVSAGILDIRRY